MIRALTPCTDPTIRPTALQRAHAYLRTGSLPPLPVLPLAAEVVLTFTISTALCLTLGHILGSSIAP